MLRNIRISNGFLEKLIVYISLFLYIYSPKLLFLKFPLGALPIVGCSYAMLKSFNFINVKIKREVVKWCGFALFFAIFSAWVTIVKNVNDFTFSILMAQSVIVNFLGSLILVNYLKESKFFIFDMDFFLKLICVCILLQSLFILMAFLMGDFRDFVESLLVSAGNIDFQEGFRVRGVSSTGGATLSLFQSLGTLIPLYFFSKRKWLGLAIVTFVLSLASNVVVGRSGIVCVLIFILYYIFLMPKKIPLLLIKILCLLFFVWGVLLNIFPEKIKFFQENVAPWAFEMFFNLMESGSANTASSDELKTMLHLPVSFTDLFFGVGSFDDSVHGVERSDSGYIKTVVSIGLPLTIVFYGLIFSKLISLYSYVDKQFFNFFLLPLMMSIVIFEIKEPFLYQNFMCRFLSLLLLFIYFRKYNSQNFGAVKGKMVLEYV